MKLFIISIFLSSCIFALEIVQTPIYFGKTRVDLTKKYIKQHYDLDVKDITIIPKIILIHYTAIDSYVESLKRFESQTLPIDRGDISKASALNVSTHFMIERDGTIHQLMPLNIMARHVIGLNYTSIGIENVGGENNVKNLTPKQLKANISLVKWLKKKVKTLNYVVAHSEYRCFENNELWLEKDAGYRTIKYDPGDVFMKDLRANISGFKSAPCKKIDNKKIDDK